VHTRTPDGFIFHHTPPTPPPHTPTQTTLFRSFVLHTSNSRRAPSQHSYCSVSPSLLSHTLIHTCYGPHYTPTHTRYRAPYTHTHTHTMDLTIHTHTCIHRETNR